MPDKFLQTGTSYKRNTCHGGTNETPTIHVSYKRKGVLHNLLIYQYIIQS